MEPAWRLELQTCCLRNTEMVQGIRNAKAGFKLLFSDLPFIDYQVKLSWQRQENGGNWYRIEGMKDEGWLCGVLYQYWLKAPETIFARADGLNEN